MRVLFLSLFLSLFSLGVFTAGGGVAYAGMEAKEIAFSRNCSAGVPVYDPASTGIACGRPKADGTGYIIEMAAKNPTHIQCPKNYRFIGTMKSPSLGSGAPATGVYYYACAKAEDRG